MNLSITQLSEGKSYKLSERLGCSRRVGGLDLMVLTLSAIVVLTGQANAGCGLTVIFDNDFNTSIQVLEVDAKTTTGSWKTVYDDAFTIAEGKKATKAIETNAGCALQGSISR